MQRVLVTGGAGFIGSTLVRVLLDPQGPAGPGVEVLTYDALTYAGLRESLAELDRCPRHRLVQANVTDAQTLDRVLREFDPDTLLHLAAESHVDRSILAPEQFLETNVRGTAVVLKGWLAHRDRLAEQGDPRADHLQLLHVSTDEVYGSLAADARPSLEGDPYRPSSPYSASKAAADHLLHAFARTYGLRAVLTHATNNYGPRQIPEKLIPRVIQCVLDQEPVPIFGDGQQVRDWIHVKDHCRALVEIAHSGCDGESYHVGAQNERTNLDVVSRLCDLMDELSPGKRPACELISHVADRPGHDTRYALNTDKLQKELDWRPEMDFEVGLRQTVLWYLDNSAWLLAAAARR